MPSSRLSPRHAFRLFATLSFRRALEVFHADFVFCFRGCRDARCCMLPCLRRVAVLRSPFYSDGVSLRFACRQRGADATICRLPPAAYADAMLLPAAADGDAYAPLYASALRICHVCCFAVDSATPRLMPMPPPLHMRYALSRCVTLRHVERRFQYNMKSLLTPFFRCR